jgi:enamine deaminase RidA (YjgF/YER057c/UK114 family)
MPNAQVNPPQLPPPSGYSHAVRAGSGALIFLAGQTGADAAGNIMAPGDLAAQFDQALANLRMALEAAGGSPKDITRLTIYVTDKAAYKANLRPLGEAYRRRLGRHYPAMTLVEVKSLFDDQALVEIDGIAVIAERAA